MGSPNAFTWAVFAFSSFSFGGISLLLNYFRDPAFSPAWVVVWLFCQLGVLITFIVIKKLVLDRVPVGPNRYWLNLSAVIVICIVRAIFSIWMQTSWGLPRSVDLAFAIASTVAFGLVHFGVATNFEQSLKLYRATLYELLETKNRLLGLRESSEIIVLEEEQKLLMQTRAELLPQLEMLDASLESTGLDRPTRAKLVHDIRDTIENQVRPLSDELKTSAHILAIHPEPALPQSLPWRWPKQINLRDSFRPGQIFSITAVVFVVTAHAVYGSFWSIFGLLAAIQVWLWLIVLRFAIPVSATLRAVLAYLLFSVLVLLPMIPVAATLFVYSSSFNDALVTSLTLSSSVVFAAVSMGVLQGIYRELESFESQLLVSIDELKRETSRFEQRIWAARRNWGYTIHGTVQSSLTAALMHLQNSASSDESLIKLVRKDIRRASQALVNQPTVRRDLLDAVGEIIDTWAGVCEIDIQFSDEALKVLLADADLCLCTKEVMKEAVANAVRHAGAKSIKASVQLEGGHSMVLEVVNDGRLIGSGGSGASAGGGFGSKIIEELSCFWSLNSDEATGLTTLTAKMALPRG